jgi:DNA polymerase III delta prime subunit
VREIRAARAFSPTAPVDEETLFAGRRQQVQQLIRVIYQRGRHAIIYGERGVGKTSLVTVLRDLLAESVPVSVSRINCDSTDNFTTVWKKVFREITFLEQHESAGFRQQTESVERSFDDMLPPNAAPDDIRRLLSIIAGDEQTVVVLDEFDRLTNNRARMHIADTIKTLSDHSVNATVLVVGVADSVEKLFSHHQSIQRATLQIHMPRMSLDELKEIVTKALAQTDLAIDDDAQSQIARLSQGLPHYTHLLGQHSAIAAVQSNAKSITMEHVQIAIGRALDETHESVRNAYRAATMSARVNLYRQVLLACALTTPDEFGFFTASSVRGPLSKITRTPHPVSSFNKHLERLCSPERASILQRKGEARRYGYRFSDPLMQPFIVLRAYHEGMIPPDFLSPVSVAHQSGEHAATQAPSTTEKRK